MQVAGSLPLPKKLNGFFYKMLKAIKFIFRNFKTRIFLKNAHCLQALPDTSGRRNQ